MECHGRWGGESYSLAGFGACPRDGHGSGGVAALYPALTCGITEGKEFSGVGIGPSSGGVTENATDPLIH